VNPAGRWGLRRRLVLAMLLGAAGALGLAPVGMWGLTCLMLLAVPALFLAASSSRQAALTGLALGIGWFAHALIWIIEPFLVDVARHGWMAPFALVFSAAGMGLFWSVGFWAAHHLGRYLGRSSRARVWALICTWSLVELARAYVLTGFPWAALAQIWTDTDAALLLAWIGPHGLAFVTLVVTMVPGLALARPGALLQRLTCLLPALVFAGFALGLAQARPVTAPLTGAIVRVIQPNAPQHQKWDPAFSPVFFKRQVDFTAAGPRPDLIVWPETSVPTLLDYAGPAFDTITSAAAGVPVVLGVQRSEGAQYFNSLVYLDETGRVAGRYDKHHLVPFGEYIPMGNIAARIGLRGFAAQEGEGFSDGPGPQVMGIDGIGKALPLICYEAVFPQDVGRAPSRPDFLLQITNDAWFGQHSGPYQHLAQARMRAIEQGLPMIRAANTGISAMIDPWGRMVAHLPLGQAGFVDAGLPEPLVPTIYARTGDLPVFVLVLAAILGLWGYNTKNKPIFNN